MAMRRRDGGREGEWGIKGNEGGGGDIKGEGGRGRG